MEYLPAPLEKLVEEFASLPASGANPPSAWPSPP